MAAAPGAPMVELDLAGLRRDPYPAYAELRRSAPLAWVPSVGRHLITRYDDIVQAEKLPEVFSSREDGSLLLRVVGPNLLREDDPAHRRLRAAAEPPSRPRHVRDVWASAFEANAARLLDELAGRGEADLIADFAEPFAAANLALVLGLRNAAAADIAAWSKAMMDGNSNYAGDPAVWSRAESAARAVDTAVAEMAATVRDTPDGSVISSMVHAAGSLDLPEIQNTVKVIIGGGVSEPRNAFGVGAWAVLQRPGLLARLLADPGTWKQVFEEAIRWISPIGMYPRQLVQEYELAGTIPPGRLPRRASDRVRQPGRIGLRAGRRVRHRPPAPPAAGLRGRAPLLHGHLDRPPRDQRNRLAPGVQPPVRTPPCRRSRATPRRLGVPRADLAERHLARGLRQTTRRNPVPIVIFQSPGGPQHKVDAAAGASLMQAAVSHHVDGIVAECGGNAACATCHVYVEAQHLGRVGPPNDVEDEMLDFTAAERRPTSRLSCQIQITDALDGLVVDVPEEQV